MSIVRDGDPYRSFELGEILHSTHHTSFPYEATRSYFWVGIDESRERVWCLVVNEVKEWESTWMPLADDRYWHRAATCPLKGG